MGEYGFNISDSDPGHLVTPHLESSLISHFLECSLRESVGVCLAPGAMQLWAL